MGVTVPVGEDVGTGAEVSGGMGLEVLVRVVVTVAGAADCAGTHPAIVRVIKRIRIL